MRVVAGDETGLVKVVSVEKEKATARHGTQSRAAGLQRLCFVTGDDGGETLEELQARCSAGGLSAAVLE